MLGEPDSRFRALPLSSLSELALPSVEGSWESKALRPGEPYPGLSWSALGAPCGPRPQRLLFTVRAQAGLGNLQ